MEALLPPEQKPKFEKFLKVYRQANEKLQAARKKKQEIQLQLITKAVTVIWKQRDPENLGYISKADCGDMVKTVLKKIGQAKIYNQESFESTFDMVIVVADLNAGVINKAQMEKVQADIIKNNK